LRLLLLLLLLLIFVAAAVAAAAASTASADSLSTSCAGGCMNACAVQDVGCHGFVHAHLQVGELCIVV